jgi:uncharacterized membrane protein
MARKDLNAWMRGEIAVWKRDGLISADQAESIAARYPAAGVGLPWGTIIFTCLGAVVAGLGVILLLAYNWQDIPKFAKLGIIVGAVAAAHAVGLRLFCGNERFRALGEGICLLGTMLFGAGIFLVAQIYHIDEHFPNAFLIWGVGALLLGLAMPSIPQSILAAVLLTIWCGAERIEFDTPMWVAPLLVAVLLAPQAYLSKSRVLMAVTIPAFLLSYAFILPRDIHSPWLTFSTLLSWSALLIAKSFLVRRIGSFPESARVLSAYGWGGFLVMLYLLSFPGMAREFFAWEQQALQWQHFFYWTVPLIGCLANWALLAREDAANPIEREAEEPGIELYLVPLTVILALCDLFYLRHFGGWMVAGPFNLVFIGLAATLMAKGCREGLLRATIGGSVLLVALVIARYFDLFESLLIRGLVFVGLGALLLTEGVLYTRTKRARMGGNP